MPVYRMPPALQMNANPGAEGWLMCCAGGPPPGELLSVCLKRIKGLNRLKLVDASFVCGPPSLCGLH
jgi:hypothetical protein